MADLIISDTDLQSLHGALHMAQKDLHSLQRMVSLMEAGSIGARPLIDAVTEFTNARRQDFTSLSRGTSRLSHKVDEVRIEMAAVDLRLSGQSQLAE